jgi:transcriptional regulator with XRE-family HTH domain
MTHKEKSIATLRKLAALAAKHGVTQVAMAEKIGIRQNAISQALSGKFHPQLDKLYRFLDTINEIAGTSYTLADVDPTGDDDN